MIFTQSLPTNTVLNWSHCNVRKKQKQDPQLLQQRDAKSTCMLEVKVIGARKWPSVDLCENAAHRPNVDLWMNSPILQAKSQTTQSHKM